MQPRTKERHMRKRTGRDIGRAVCTAAALAAVAAVPATADAKPKPKPIKQATFTATLSGSQVTTWEYHKQKDKDNPCDAGADGYGDQTVKFNAGRRFRITFSQPPKNNPDLFGTAGHPAVLIAPIYLKVNTRAERNGDLTVHGEQVDHQNCPGDNGGADPGYTPTPKDCGVRTGTFNTKVYFHDSSADADLYVPVLPKTENNWLSVEGWQYEWSKADGSDSDSELRNTYVNCPFELEDSYIDNAGHIYIGPGRLSEKQLFDKKRKKFVVSGDHTFKRGGGYTSGQTILAWNLRLTRVK
jgi:hypothetical protein